MVLVQHANSPQPETARIVGMTGAIALNIVLLLLLLAIKAPLVFTQDQDLVVVPDPVDIKPPETPPVQATVTPPATIAPTVRSTTTPPPQIAVNPQTVAEAVNPIETRPETALPTTVASTATTSIADPPPAMRLEYEKAPAPRYPPDALRASLEGVVMLEVLVDVDGKPLQVRINRSSGHRVLDETARRHVLKLWTFRPAMKDGRAVQAVGIVPIDFHLGR